MQECFTAGYASFNGLDGQVQYSTTAGGYEAAVAPLPGTTANAGAIANKYDPRLGGSKYGSDAGGKGSKAGRAGVYVEGDTGAAGKDFDQHGGGGGYDPYADARGGGGVGGGSAAGDEVDGGYGAATRGGYWATTAAH